uniref:Uncharacterized protein n=1 Tax=Parascaris equorum TaxID=6256 RepID=A0A914S3S2_PAREQ
MRMLMRRVLVVISITRICANIPDVVPLRIPASFRKTEC